MQWFWQQCKGVWKWHLTISVLHCRTKICQFLTVSEWNFFRTIDVCGLDTSVRFELKKAFPKDCSTTLPSINNHLNPSIFLSLPCWLLIVAHHCHQVITRLLDAPAPLILDSLIDCQNQNCWFLPVFCWLIVTGVKFHQVLHNRVRTTPDSTLRKLSAQQHKGQSWCFDSETSWFKFTGGGWHHGTTKKHHCQKQQKMNQHGEI